jgi:tRNA threonylcarbamoyl adenosine modification protein YeaZ
MTRGPGATAGGGDAGDRADFDTNGRRPWLLVIDSATSRVVVAAAALDGELLGATTWEAGRTHGEQLLPAIGRLHGEANLRRSRIRGVIVGTGPGAFTGLRVGLASAKAIAHELDVPIAGVSTGEALLRAAGEAEAAGAARAVAGRQGRPDRLVLLLPAGPNDRHLVRHDAEPVLLPGGVEPALADGEVLVAVDLVDRAPADALERGEHARAGFAAALARLGAARLDAGGDDLARLVPEYVSLPRGVTSEQGEVAWSRDPR